MILLFSSMLVDYITVFGVSSNSFSLQLQVPCSSNRIQLQEIIPLSDFQSFLAITHRPLSGPF